MTLHKIGENKEILLNKMYVGEFLLENIGHEIINLLKSDNGKNYIYINHLGTMKKEHNDKIDTIILVRNTGIKDTLEVLAQAWDLEQIARVEQTSHKKEIRRIHNEQIKYIKDNKITYCGKLLNEIYDEYSKSNDEVYITFKANELRRPKKQIFITFCGGNEILPFIDKEKCHLVFLNKQNKANKATNIVNQAKMSLKMYISKESEKQKYAFIQLQNLLEDESLWEDKNTTTTVDIIKTSKLNEHNFIDLVDKQYAEVTYSSLFKHIFESSSELFTKFANEVLSIGNISKNITVKREEGHIDLLIEDKENVIVIENKIKSGINSEKYDIYGDLVTDQLRDYYEYVSGNKRQGSHYVPDEELTKKYASKNAFFYIFAPDYNHINEERLEQSVLLGCVKYNVINYSRIYDFFNRYRKDYSNKISYYEEFLYALSKHTGSIDNALEKEMQNRFASVIG